MVLWREKSVLPRNSSLFAGMQTMFAREFTMILGDARVLRREISLFPRKSTMFCGTETMFARDLCVFSRELSMLRRGDSVRL